MDDFFWIYMFLIYRHSIKNADERFILSLSFYDDYGLKFHFFNMFKIYYYYHANIHPIVVVLKKI
jgi:hypothetical protein